MRSVSKHRISKLLKSQELTSQRNERTAATQSRLLQNEEEFKYRARQGQVRWEVFRLSRDQVIR